MHMGTWKFGGMPWSSNKGGSNSSLKYPSGRASTASSFSLSRSSWAFLLLSWRAAKDSILHERMIIIVSIHINQKTSLIDEMHVEEGLLHILISTLAAGFPSQQCSVRLQSCCYSGDTSQCEVCAAHLQCPRRSFSEQVLPRMSFHPPQYWFVETFQGVLNPIHLLTLKALRNSYPSPVANYRFIGSSIHVLEDV